MARFGWENWITISSTYVQASTLEKTVPNWKPVWKNNNARSELKMKRLQVELIVILTLTWPNFLPLEITIP